MAKLSSTSSVFDQFNALEVSRKRALPFTKKWLVSPLDKKAEFPALCIEYSFDMPEEDLCQHLKEIRQKYNIAQPVKETDYQRVIRHRNQWLLALDVYLDGRYKISKSKYKSDITEQIKPGFLKSNILKGIVRDGFILGLPKKIISKSKKKFTKYRFMITLLKEQEEADPFGFNLIRRKFKKRNLYELNETTLKSLLNDLRNRR